jgi:hypothetical protein
MLQTCAVAPGDIADSLGQLKSSLTDDPGQLDSIALGAYVTCYGLSASPPRDAAIELLRSIKQKLDSQQPKVADKYLANIFVLTGIDATRGSR